MQILDELAARGLLADVTDRAGLTDLLAKESVTAYAGFDPTSSSLHVGSLVPVILLKRLQLAGHRPIIVVGGATGMVGDPSGKSDERNLLDDATLQANVIGIRDQLARLLDFEDPRIGAVMTNNADWTRGVSLLEFMRDIGKYLTVNYMMAKDSVKNRLDNESGISWTEFSYMLLQAFDFVELNKQYGCRLQVGGSDQYGNITAGTELSRKMGRTQLFGLTAPLLLDSTGQKMGKTSTGERIWLDAARTPPFEFYKYWFNVSDADVGRFLKMFSLRPLAELDELLAEHDRDRAKHVAQRELARALTSWVHGDAAVTRVEAANRVFATGTLEGLSLDELAALAETIPTVDIPRTELSAGIGIVDLLARTVAESKSDARRTITQGGAYVNNARIADDKHKVGADALVHGAMLLVRAGKKNLRLVRAV
ncbi:MAG: tyrosine--tRNA ligase [Deltaproteobacteria bacterium]|nr:tyrosine--tRNA ligase [Deltaproteobacteria bacterium]